MGVSIICLKGPLYHGRFFFFEAVLENNVYTTNTLKVDDSFQLILDGVLKDPSKFPMFKNKTAKAMRSYWDKQILGKHRKLYMSVDGTSSSATPPTESMELQLVSKNRSHTFDAAF